MLVDQLYGGVPSEVSIFGDAGSSTRLRADNMHFSRMVVPTVKWRHLAMMTACATAALSCSPWRLRPSFSTVQSAPDGPAPAEGAFLQRFDLCAARPVKPLWPVPGLPGPPLQVKVATYNLFWWNLMDLRHGMRGSAGKLLSRFGKSQPFDVMGFQECINGVRVLQDGGLIGNYTLREVHEGGSKDVCIAYRTDAWQELSFGHEDVAEDRKVQYFGNRTAQWVRLRHILTGRTLLFVNHHGPLPISTGGRCGGKAVAHNLLDLMVRVGKPKDLVILVGDFNAVRTSETIRTLEAHMTRIFTGAAFNGVDNIFTNAGSSSLILRQNMGSGGSDHDALGVVVAYEPGKDLPPGDDDRPGFGQGAPDCCNASVGRVQTGSELDVAVSIGCTKGSRSLLDQGPGMTAKSQFLGSGSFLVARPTGQIQVAHASQGRVVIVAEVKTGVSYDPGVGRFLVDDDAPATPHDECVPYTLPQPAWSTKVDVVPTADACCRMCVSGYLCQAWSWAPSHAEAALGALPFEPGGVCTLLGVGLWRRKPHAGAVSGMRPSASAGGSGSAASGQPPRFMQPAPYVPPPLANAGPSVHSFPSSAVFSSPGGLKDFPIDEAKLGAPTKLGRPFPLTSGTG
mmetsp:Transcript_103419/g.299200  ORF Transcript_103419/g.299200 Transcript_103419/m.299200 type:complete len:623 (-) Transcript_103419:281-2149(-)|eukprot:CAMPEP_0176118496 /NCGR_PEP_ID=MMETSP0120_2-20121206/59553_1 /TAXON_ID=160619 /ORGANISM="Kryptoperidinium foliaceum, Strain CCMP 1326" /LENGTH=622 /DNA_ID=CAMNT_0017452839 /DNA_START=79 /DNA_END=1947 /DNA_ORIENTATION=-